jgi:hypothetical protein
MQRNEVTVADRITNPFGPTDMKDAMMFNSEFLPPNPLAFNSVYASAHFVIDRNLGKISRLNYTSMDYIRDVGAMFLALHLLCHIILNRIFNLPVLLENDMLMNTFRERM